ncbi:response regulator [Aeromicrobium alkaliterrae]|uniref:Transcriptional regulatory protein n=1 Tax=Aeromicrobium alkaliterrae TaxID=302168 RepID=A0ABP4VRU2_9ACTN
MTTRDLRVLVVDDDFMVARIHQKFVERTPGFEVVGTARTGTEAISQVEHLVPDILLLDVHLPDFDGLEVLRRLRGDGHEVGVIMVTAERDSEVVRSALLGGAQQYLVKPFEHPALSSRLEAVRTSLEALGALEDVDQGAIDQASIDRAFGATLVAANLPKGLSQETATAVLEALRVRGELSASEAGDAVGLSRVSARRYLEHFVAVGRASVRLQYGATGRPERRYSPS